MIFQSSILALLLASGLSALIILWAAWFASSVLRGWDVASGNAKQVAMERKTYLVSTALVFVMALELGSLMLFVYNADKMAVMFTGAMCAVGTLNVNAYGFPALLFKLGAFFGATVWLIINHVDGKGRDYPLTRFKYSYLMGLAPVMLAAGGLQFAYFYNIELEVITSCCSRLFTPESSGIEAYLAAMDARLALWLIFGGLAVMTGLATLALALQKPLFNGIYAALSPFFFVAVLVGIISVIAPYIYAQPYHHCPFCILKPEYDYIGYALYLTLFVGTAFALAAGFLSLPLKAVRAESLSKHLPKSVRQAIYVSILSYLAFGAVSLYAIWSSHLIMFR